MKVFKTSALASGNSKLHPPYLVFDKLGVKLIEPGMFKSKETFDYYENINPVSIETKLIGFATVNIHGRNIHANLHGFSNADAKQIRDLVMLSKTSTESLLARIGEFTCQEPTSKPAPVFTSVSSTPSSYGRTTNIAESKIVKNDTYKHVKVTEEIKCKDVVVDEGITDFEMMALPNDVHSVTFPASLRSITEGCEGFPMLEIVDFSKVTMLEEIPDMLLVGCKSLKEVVFPHGIKVIGDAVFDECSSLERIVIPETVKKLGSLYGDTSKRASVFLFCPPSEDMEFFEVPYSIYVAPMYLDAYKRKFLEDGLATQVQPIADEYLNKYYLNDSNAASGKFVKRGVRPNNTMNRSSETESQSAQSVQQIQISANVQKAPVLPPPPPAFSYYAMIENKQQGPYDKIQFKRLVDYGLIKSDNYVWAEGMSEWKKANEIDDMREFFPNTGVMPPPLP